MALLKHWIYAFQELIFFSPKKAYRRFSVFLPTNELVRRHPKVSRELFCHDISAEENTALQRRGFLPYFLAKFDHFFLKRTPNLEKFLVGPSIAIRISEGKFILLEHNEVNPSALCVHKSGLAATNRAIGSRAGARALKSPSAYLRGGIVEPAAARKEVFLSKEPSSPPLFELAIPHVFSSSVLTNSINNAALIRIPKPQTNGIQTPPKRKKVDAVSSFSTSVVSPSEKRDVVLQLINKSTVSETESSRNNLRIQEARNSAVAQAQSEGCMGNFKIFDSPYGNYLVPVIPTRAELGG
ncbi:UNVERIFIED_CONTAM: hypothetical protein Scaly_1679200 [Sesamum calycinum]|uniref:Uncharacterized protein n=1 Tax=Sesamum calycinum TaxID=2727403 RepID=A0AAW2NUJ0_9LAMI